MQGPDRDVPARTRSGVPSAGRVRGSTPLLPLRQFVQPPVETRREHPEGDQGAVDGRHRRQLGFRPSKARMATAVRAAMASVRQQASAGPTPELLSDRSWLRRRRRGRRRWSHRRCDTHAFSPTSFLNGFQKRIPKSSQNSHQELLADPFAIGFLYGVPQA